MRLLSTAGLPTSWPWRIVAICSLVALLGVAIYAPYLVVMLLAATLAVVIVGYLRMRAAIIALAAQIQAGALARKLEVQTGAWGALCHAVNGMLQQQALQQRMDVLRPDLPQVVLDQVVDGVLVAETITAYATVLVLGLLPDASMRVESWQQLAQLGREHAQRHGALLQWCSDAVVLVFGVHKQQGRTTGLRTALEIAHAVRTAWDAEARPPLTLTVASGQINAGVLPGLGYSVLGVPVDQALRLQQLAVMHPTRALLCPEETYVALRSLQQDLRRATGSALPATHDWQQTDLRLLQPNRPPQVVYGRVL